MQPVSDAPPRVQRWGWGLAAILAFTCSFCGFVLYQVDSCLHHDWWCSREGSVGVGTVSWNVGSLSMFTFGIYISTDQTSRK